MDADLDTPATARHATTDDLLKRSPHLAPRRPRVGITPKLSDAEPLTLAVTQAPLGFVPEARWLRHAGRHPRHPLPDLPGQSGDNQRLRRAVELLRQVIRAVAGDTTLWSDDGWVVDSTPGGVRPLAPDRRALRAGRVGAVRLLRQPLALVLGAAAAAGVHPCTACQCWSR